MRSATRLMAAAVAAAGIAAGAFSETAFAQTSYIGQIKIVAFNYCPRNWAEANGQTLAISQYSELFSLLGTVYGGNGTTTFALPDLRGRMPIGRGEATDLSPVKLGQKGGTQSFTLSTEQMPSHSHAVVAGKGTAKESNPTGATLGKSAIYATGTPSTALNSASVASTGEARSIAKQSPYLGLIICIATTGAIPPRPQPQ